MNGIESAIASLMAICGGYAVRTRHWGYAIAFAIATTYIVVRAYA